MEATKRVLDFQLHQMHQRYTCDYFRAQNLGYFGASDDICKMTYLNRVDAFLAGGDTVREATFRFTL